MAVNNDVITSNPNDLFSLTGPYFCTTENNIQFRDQNQVESPKFIYNICFMFVYLLIKLMISRITTNK